MPSTPVSALSSTQIALPAQSASLVTPPAAESADLQRLLQSLVPNAAVNSGTMVSAPSTDAVVEIQKALLELTARVDELKASLLRAGESAKLGATPAGLPAAALKSSSIPPALSPILAALARLVAPSVGGAELVTSAGGTPIDATTQPAGRGAGAQTRAPIASVGPEQIVADLLQAVAQSQPRAFDLAVIRATQALARQLLQLSGGSPGADLPTADGKTIRPPASAVPVPQQGTLPSPPKAGDSLVKALAQTIAPALAADAPKSVPSPSIHSGAAVFPGAATPADVQTNSTTITRSAFPAAGPVTLIESLTRAIGQWTVAAGRTSTPAEALAQLRPALEIIQRIAHQPTLESGHLKQVVRAVQASLNESQVPPPATGSPQSVLNLPATPLKFHLRDSALLFEALFPRSTPREGISALAALVGAGLQIAEEAQGVRAIFRFPVMSGAAAGANEPSRPAPASPTAPKPPAPPGAPATVRTQHPSSPAAPATQPPPLEPLFDADRADRRIESLLQNRIDDDPLRLDRMPQYRLDPTDPLFTQMVPVFQALQQNALNGGDLARTSPQGIARFLLEYHPAEIVPPGAS